MKKFQNSLVFAICIFLSSLSLAHVTLGTFDLNRALFETEAWDSEFEAFEEKFSEEQTTVIQLGTELEELFANIQTNGPTMTEMEIQRLREDGQFKQLRMQQINERVRASLQETQNNFLERYRQLLGEAINEVYEQGAYDFILKADSVVISGFTFDVTPTVTAKLNELIAANSR